MSDSAGALRATSDALLNDLDSLQALEQEKRAIEPGDPRLTDVADQIAQLAARVLGASVRQRTLTERVNHLVATGSPDAPDAPIEDIPREMRLILADWRDAERRASMSAPGSADAVAAAADIDRLRDEYRRAFEEARERD